MGSTLQVNGAATFNGIVDMNSGLQLATVTKTGTYTIATSDHTVFADATSAAFTLTLPAAAAGLRFEIVKIDSGANIVTIDGNGSETINGATTYALNLQYDSITIVSNGSNWFIVA